MSKVKAEQDQAEGGCLGSRNTRSWRSIVEENNPLSSGQLKFHLVGQPWTFQHLTFLGVNIGLLKSK